MFSGYIIHSTLHHINTDKHIVNIMKVYIETNSMQVELI